MINTYILSKRKASLFSWISKWKGREGIKRKKEKERTEEKKKLNISKTKNIEYFSLRLPSLWISNYERGRRRKKQKNVCY